MLTNPSECSCESYECVANEITIRHMRSYLHIHIVGVSLRLLFARHCYSLSAFFHYTTRISIRMLVNLYKRLTITRKCVAIDKNGLIATASEYVVNMLRICIFTKFRNMFLKFAKPRERQ